MTGDEAMLQAAKYGLVEEVAWSMDHGCTPEEALKEWDI